MVLVVGVATAKNPKLHPGVEYVRETSDDEAVSGSCITLN